MTMEKTTSFKVYLIKHGDFVGVLNLKQSAFLHMGIGLVISRQAFKCSFGKENQSKNDQLIFGLGELWNDLS